MSFNNDPYPSRTDAALDPIERLDPVVYSAANQQEGPLSEQQLKEYDRNGFLVLESFFEQSYLQKFFDDLDEYEEDEGFKRQAQVITEPNSDEIRSVFAIHKVSERFSRLTQDPRLLGIAQQILGSDVYIHQSRINDKPGFCGSGFDWHSDFETWHTEDGMPRMRCFSMSILLSENNELNGPLMLIPGSHKWFIPTRGRTPEQNWKSSLKAQKLGVPERDSLRRMTQRGGLVAPKGPAGSIILFECNTLHASSNNLSPWRRSNLFFVYNSVENKLVKPYCGQSPRPEYIAARADTPVLRPLSEDTQHDYRRVAGLAS